MPPRTFNSINALFLFLVLLLLVACQTVEEPLVTPSPVAVAPTLTPTPRPTYTPEAPLFLPATATPQPVPVIPTPTLFVPTPVPDIYFVTYGDTLLGLAGRFGCTVEALVAMNPQLGGQEELKYGDVLYVPSSITVSLPYSNLAYDSEVVYGPSYLTWNTEAFIREQGGYLSNYREGEKTAAEIVDSVAVRYQLGPRVLLNAIEVASGWVTEPLTPTQIYPLGLEDPNREKLSLQLAWAARLIGEGYYGQLEGRRDWVMLENNVRARLAPGTTAGSAGVANLMARVVKPAGDFPNFLQGGQWQATYERLFGDVEGGPVMPPDGKQPYFAMPWSNEEPWWFTGGPHGGYGDSVTGWSALDFAPPIPSGCYPSIYPVKAVVPGLVMVSDQGETWVDLDGDGDMRTGWVLLYMHLATNGRVAAGTYVEVGDVMGFPSCEGGISSGAHLHLARLYHGQWMPASGPVPFQLGNWQASAQVGSSYDGYLTNTKTGQVMEACNCRSVRQNKFPYETNKVLGRPSGR